MDRMIWLTAWSLTSKYASDVNDLKLFNLKFGVKFETQYCIINDKEIFVQYLETHDTTWFPTNVGFTILALQFKKKLAERY